MQKAPKHTVLILVSVLLLTTAAVAQESQKTLAEYLQAGIAAQKAGEFEEALQYYAAALKLEPKNFGAQFNSGSAYMSLNAGKRPSTHSRLRLHSGPTTQWSILVWEKLMVLPGALSMPSTR